MQPLKTAFNSLDLSSRGRRRKATALAAGLLHRIRAAEEAYLGRIPENLQNSHAYDNADCSIGLLEEAIDLLASAYD